MTPITPIRPLPRSSAAVRFDVPTVGRRALPFVASLGILLAAGLPLNAQSRTRSPAVGTQQQAVPAGTTLASPDRAGRPRSGGPVFGTSPAEYVPTLSQLGSSTALVPMKHGSCGLECGTHVLAVQNGNLNMQLQVGMSCPAGASVNHLSFKPTGQNATSVVAQSTGQSAYSKTLFAQPFSKNELESACQQALGGSWAEPGTHNNSSAEVKKTIVKSVSVWGQCTGWANKVKRTYPVSLTLTCRDQSWFVPIP